MRKIEEPNFQELKNEPAMTPSFFQYGINLFKGINTSPSPPPSADFDVDL